MEDLWLGCIAIAVGVFSALAGVMDWNWFILTSKAQFVVKVLGRNGARIFYVALGVLFLAGGVALLVAPSS